MEVTVSACWAGAGDVADESARRCCLVSKENAEVFQKTAGLSRDRSSFTLPWQPPQSVLHITYHVLADDREVSWTVKCHELGLGVASVLASMRNI